MYCNLNRLIGRTEFLIFTLTESMKVIQIGYAILILQDV